MVQEKVLYLKYMMELVDIEEVDVHQPFVGIFDAPVDCSRVEV